MLLGPSFIPYPALLVNILFRALQQYGVLESLVIALILFAPIPLYTAGSPSLFAYFQFQNALERNPCLAKRAHPSLTSKRVCSKMEKSPHSLAQCAISSKTAVESADKRNLSAHDSLSVSKCLKSRPSRTEGFCRSSRQGVETTGPFKVSLCSSDNNMQIQSKFRK